MSKFNAQENKIGNFDWITEFNEIEEYLQNKFTGLDKIEKCNVRVLVIGCGTSKLSAQLADAGFGEVVSIDNDSECISHMKKMHRDDERLKWFTYDIVEPESLQTDEHTTNITLGKFDLVVDKGTLDAILVEGAIYTMLYEVHRLLNTGGAYVLFSLNTEKLLGPLLSTDALGYDVKCHQIQKKIKAVCTEPVPAVTINGKHAKDNSKDSIGKSIQTGKSVIEEYTDKLLQKQFEEKNDVIGTVVICRKICSDVVDINQLMLEEQEVMDNYFKVESPFLTAEQEEKIRINFEGRFLALNTNLNSKLFDLDKVENIDSMISLCLSDAYNVMFEDEEALEYSYDLFMEDIATYPLQVEGFMTATEAISFLQTMQ